MAVQPTVGGIIRRQQNGVQCSGAARHCEEEALPAPPGDPLQQKGYGQVKRETGRSSSRAVCTDCSIESDPSRASVNRGTFIRDECCSVHRSLGHHISQVRHLKYTPWPPTLLQMVETLYNNGADSIWEHSLLDPASVMSGRRKANPQDEVHPDIAEFIRTKTQMLKSVHRLPCCEDDSMTAKDLSKQLHSRVLRTGNLETCLRLLSLGAQANFFHPEKGSTPLHIASKAGQILQAELLSVFGADLGTQDSSGKTPVDYARQGGRYELAEHLREIQYELTDRLVFHLCDWKPDHKNGQHFIIPQMAHSLDLSELAKAAKKLQSHQQQELHHHTATVLAFIIMIITSISITIKG
ncbi:ARF GTPase-activating protein GIT2-like [Mastomys coucha]|uniref:ARF GTPase-activating protein GIT2-like n=1 Tax=Mastomys coucha TaxID=35658 RepID=UPI0012619F35|nr:ARF GTPase-activating protein GIT2-like [Mastomys coucha]